MIGGRPEKAKGGNQDGSGCPSAKNTFSKQPKIKTAASLLGMQSNKQKFYAKPSIEGDPASWPSSRFLKRECFLATQDSVALVFFKAHRDSIVVTETKLLKWRCIKPTKQPFPIARMFNWPKEFRGMMWSLCARGRNWICRAFMLFLTMNLPLSISPTDRQDKPRQWLARLGIKEELALSLLVLADSCGRLSAAKQKF